MAAYDDTNDNQVKDDNFSKNLYYVWENLDKARSSDTETWPTDLAKLLYDKYQDLFGAIPNDIGKKSN